MKENGMHENMQGLNLARQERAHNTMRQGTSTHGQKNPQHMQGEQWESIRGQGSRKVIKECAAVESEMPTKVSLMLMP